MILLTFIILNILDLITTVILFLNDGTEQNPFMMILLQNNIIFFIIIKLIILYLIVFVLGKIIYSKSINIFKVTFIFLNLTYIIIVLNNLYWLTKVWKMSGHISIIIKDNNKTIVRFDNNNSSNISKDLEEFFNRCKYKGLV